MKVIIPEEVNFKISTTNIKVEYTERDDTHLSLDTLLINDYLQKNNYKLMRISFKDVAEIKCISLNFYESNYGGFEIFKIDDELDEMEFWNEYGYNFNSGFYQVDNSEWLSELKNKYDPRGRLGLLHYIIIGYDSYVEIIASTYFVTIVQ